MFVLLTIVAVLLALVSPPLVERRREQAVVRTIAAAGGRNRRPTIGIENSSANKLPHHNIAAGRKPSGFAAPDGSRRPAKSVTYVRTSPKSVAARPKTLGAWAGDLYTAWPSVFSFFPDAACEIRASRLYPALLGIILCGMLAEVSANEVVISPTLHLCGPDCRF